MKRQGYILRRMILGVFVVLVVTISQGQIGGEVLKVKIPFNFNVGTQAFPAGEYTLKPLLPHTMVLRNQAGQPLTNITTNSVESSEVQTSVKLVFNGYGGQYFLTQIWNAGDSTGQQLAKSSVEVEMARKYPAGEQIALQVVARR